METQIFDDGSTLTFDPVSGYYNATPAAADGINVPVAGWSPQIANPAASSWEDVIRLGFARTIDAITRPLELTNTQPLLQQPQYVRYVAGKPTTAYPESTIVLLAVGAALLFFLLKR